jgi:hypothetical protein
LPNIFLERLQLLQRSHHFRGIRAGALLEKPDPRLTLGTKNRIPETEPNYPRTEPNFPNRSVSVPISEYPKYPSTEPKFLNRTEVPEVSKFAQSYIYIYILVIYYIQSCTILLVLLYKTFQEKVMSWRCLWTVVCVYVEPWWTPIEAYR